MGVTDCTPATEIDQLQSANDEIQRSATLLANLLETLHHTNDLIYITQLGASARPLADRYVRHLSFDTAVLKST